ncbi:MAG: NAD(P)-dependent oxidoreductase [Pseudomonadota bacterium]
MEKQTVGLIGLGNMGCQFAKRLIDHEFKISVWGRTPEKLKSWETAGVTVTANPQELAETTDVVILCVTDTTAVEQVVFAKHGIAASTKPVVLIDHSTIHPVTTQEFADRLLTANRSSWLDIPVSGGPAGAQSGTLIGMAGGDEKILTQVTHILSSYIERLTRMGDVGAGQATKVVNQMVVGGNIAVLAEALNYADNFGVSAAQIPEALTGGWADSRVLQVHGRRMTSADYSTEADARIMLKDIDIALDMGAKTTSRMPVTALVRKAYNKLIELGHADKGQSGLMWLFKQKPLS